MTKWVDFLRTKCCKCLKIELDLTKVRMPRTEAMMILFGQEDLVIAEFPHLNKIVINLR